MEMLRALGGRLAAEGWRPRRAFSSPLVRARQSLEIVLAAAGVEIEPEVLKELVPEGEPAALLRTLDAHGVTTGPVILVSHQPLLGDLAHHLCGQPFRFEPGTLVRLQCPLPLAMAGGMARPEGSTP